MAGNWGSSTGLAGRKARCNTGLAGNTGGSAGLAGNLGGSTGLAGRKARWQHGIGRQKGQVAADDWLEEKPGGSTGLAGIGAQWQHGIGQDHGGGWGLAEGWVQWGGCSWGSRTRAGGGWGAGGAQAAPGAGCDPPGQGVGMGTGTSPGLPRPHLHPQPHWGTPRAPQETPSSPTFGIPQTPRTYRTPPPSPGSAERPGSITYGIVRGAPGRGLPRRGRNVKRGVRPVLTVALSKSWPRASVSLPVAAALAPSSERRLERAPHLHVRLWHLGAVVNTSPVGVLLV